MKTTDDGSDPLPEQNPSSSSIEFIATADDSHLSQNDSEVSTIVTVEARGDNHRYAQVRFECTWTWNTFTCQAKQYYCANNHRKSGNLSVEFGSATTWARRELTNDNGHQTMQWIDIAGGGTVDSNFSNATIQIWWMYDEGLGSDWEMYGSLIISAPNIPPPTPSIGPNKNFTASTFDVTGTGGIAGANMVLDHGGGTLATRVQPTGGAWLVRVTVSDSTNSQRMQAYQQVNGRNSSRTPLIQMYRAKLTQPTAGAVVPMKDLVYRAIGAPGSAMYALGMDWSSQYTEKKLVDTSGNWQAPSTHDFPSGDAEVRVRFYDDPAATASYGYTQSVTFKVLGYPRTTLPAAASLQNSNFDLSGDNGLAQSRIVAYYDLTDTAVGQSTVRQDGTWTIPVAVRVGSVSLAVEQSSGGKSSGRGTYRSFKIKPPQPAKLTVQVDAQGKVTLGGVGHIGATFYLHVANNGTPFYSFTVTTSPWTELFPGWLPGTSLIDGRQSVSDVEGQPIYSDWISEGTTVVVPVPPPKLSLRVSPDGIPTFSGTGRNWSGQPNSTVEVNLGKTSTPVVPIATVLADSNWSSSTKSRLSPGTFLVSARQWFEGVSSEWLASIPMIVPTPPAVIDKVIANGLLPQVEGQCWPGAVMTITFSDIPDPHSLSDTDKDGTWTFQRLAAFRPGRHTVTVTQTFGGQTSNPVSMSFDIVVRVLVITPPPGGQADHLPVLHGTGGIDGFTIRVFDFVTHDLLGETLATGDAWSVRLKELDYLTHTVSAIQVLGDLESLPSNSVTFEVKLFAPRIDSPTTRTSVPRTFTVEGYARAGKEFDRTEVDVYLDGVAHRVYPHSGDGYFKQHFTRPVGPCVLNARQYFKDQESPLSEDVQVTIVPDMAHIETPGIGEAVGQAVPICGFGYPEDEVAVALPDGTELGLAKVHEDGTWFYLIETPGAYTDLSLVIEQRKGEYRSGWSEPRPVRRLAAPPTFDEPEEGKWEVTTPEFAGGALDTSQVEVVAWYNADEKHASALVANGGRWAGVSERDLPAGPQWARAVQVVGGKHSMPADSKRFEVAPSDEPPGLA